MLSNSGESTDGKSARRVALITGASRGIGRAVALQAARSGLDLLLLARSSEFALDETVDMARELGVQAHGLLADVADDGTAERIAAQTGHLYGRLDVLINNAGRARVSTVDDLSVEAWDATLNVNLRGPFFLIQACLPLLRMGTNPSIVNIASVVARTGGSVGPDYAASKGGIVAMTRYLARQLREDGIRVNAVAPSPTATDMLDYLATERPEIDTSAAGSPEDVAEVVIYLVNSSSTFLGGECIYLTGGA